MRRPWLSIALAAGALIALAIPALRLNLATSGPDDLPQDLELIRTYNLVRDAFPVEGVTADVVVTGDGVRSGEIGNDIDKLVRKAEASPGVLAGTSIDYNLDGSLAKVSIPPEGSEGKQSDVFSPEAEQRVSWDELSTSDPVAARKFYTVQFGWGTDEFMDMGEMGEYRFIERDGSRIGALCGLMPGQSPRWRYYIRVPSIAASAEAVKAGGGTVAMGPHEVPGGDHIIIGIDPQGAEFALVGKA